MSKKLVCVMFHDYELNDAQKKGIEQICRDNDYSCVFCLRDEAKDLVSDAEIIYGYDAELISLAPDLKWFASTWAGVGQYLKEGLMKDETLLSNSSGCFGPTISEHMITVLLMMMRRIPDYQEIIRNGDWRNDYQIDTIHGSTLVVVGTGDIGTEFALRAKAFSPKKIIGVNRSGLKKNDIYDEVFKIGDLAKALPEADAVVMSLPGTAETVGIITREMLEIMKDGSYLVNVGRGNSIDEDALADALNSGKLKGAALDVFVTEPLPMDSPLRSAKNCLITPHCSGQMGAQVTRDLHYDHFTEDLRRYFRGELPIYLVDRKKGY